MDFVERSPLDARRARIRIQLPRGQTPDRADTPVRHPPRRGGAHPARRGLLGRGCRSRRAARRAREHRRRRAQSWRSTSGERVAALVAAVSDDPSIEDRPAQGGVALAGLARGRGAARSSRPQISKVASCAGARRRGVERRDQVSSSTTRASSAGRGVPAPARRAAARRARPAGAPARRRLSAQPAAISSAPQPPSEALAAPAHDDVVVVVEDRPGDGRERLHPAPSRSRHAPLVQDRGHAVAARTAARRPLPARSPAASPSMQQGGSTLRTLKSTRARTGCGCARRSGRRCRPRSASPPSSSVTRTTPRHHSGQARGSCRTSQAAAREVLNSQLVRKR